MTLARTLSFCLLLVLDCTLGACVATRSSPGSVCDFNSDCLAGLFCVGGACRRRCIEDRDCVDPVLTGSIGARCVLDPDTNQNTCLPPADAGASDDTRTSADATGEIATTDARGDEAADASAPDQGGPGPTPSPSVLCAGYNHSCVVLASQLYCWGNNHSQQLGPGADTSATAVAVPGLDDVVEVACGQAEYTCVRRRDGSVACFGDNTGGLLGTMAPHTSATPLTIAAAAGSSQLATSRDHACAVRADQTVVCWGQSNHQQTGSMGGHMTAPAAIPGLAGVRAVSAGDFVSCAASGAVSQCWGSSGGLVNGMPADQLMPRAVADLSMSAVALGTGSNFACALDAHGTLRCWGDNTEGRLGLGTAGGNRRPNSDTATAVRQFSAGNTHSCAVTTNGGVLCWGSNANGELGGGSSAWSASPTTVALPAAATAVQVAAGYAHSCALTAAGAVYCWGRDDCGQLGDNGPTNMCDHGNPNARSAMPVLVLGLP